MREAVVGHEKWRYFQECGDPDKLFCAPHSKLGAYCIA